MALKYERMDKDQGYHRAIRARSILFEKIMYLLLGEIF
jgi:hypothetical protein